jgi:hypothetical protein
MIVFLLCSWLPLKKVWVGMENLAERSGPKRPTLIEHYNGSLTCMECGIFHTRVPTMVHDTPFSVAIKNCYPGLTTPLTFYNCLYSLNCSRPEYSWNTAHWTLKVHDQAFLLWPDYPPTRGPPPIRHPGTRWAALWDRTLVTLNGIRYNLKLLSTYTIAAQRVPGWRIGGGPLVGG